MANKKSIGLPGGPNEFLQDITQYISVDGYKRHSDDKINPVNIIESGSITMEDVDFPVYGVDNLGNEQMMFPENDYQFPGDIVMEMPMLAKNGRELPTAQNGIGDYFQDFMTSLNPYNYAEEGNYFFDQKIPTYYGDDKDEAFSKAHDELGAGKMFLHDGVRYKTDHAGKTEDADTNVFLASMNKANEDGVFDNYPGVYDRLIESWTELGQPNISKGRDKHEKLSRFMPHSWDKLGFDYADHVNPLTDRMFIKEYKTGDPKEWMDAVINELGHVKQQREMGRASYIGRYISELMGAGFDQDALYDKAKTLENEAHNKEHSHNDILSNYIYNGVRESDNKKYGGSLPEAQWGALGRAAKPAMKKGISYLKSFFDDAVEVTDDVVEKVVKKNPIAESVANTPKTLDRPPAEDYVFYRYADDESTIMKPLDFENPRIYDSGKRTPENLTFFSPNTWAYDGYSGVNGKLFGANIKPKNPYTPFKGEMWDVETVQKLIDEGYDAIMPHYGRGDDIRDAYEIIPLDKNIITNLNRLRKYGGGDLPQAQWGAFAQLVKQAAKKAPGYIDDFFRSSNKFTSEIDWGAFNKAIPENKILMQEYNLIEETTKANKTWMKNADGSAFNGTPEQFVQMKSGNFQKAFGNTMTRDAAGNIQIVTHKTDEVFDAFDPNQIGSRTDEGFHGRGFYFHAPEVAPYYGNYYGNINMPSYVNTDKVVKGRLGTDAPDFLRNMEYLTDNPNNIKSAVGNDGMFNLTNPNIYKQWGGGLANTIYKFATDSDYEWTDALYDYTLAPLSNALDVLSVPGALVAEAGEYFGERGDKEFNFTDAMPALKGDYSFKNMNDGDMKTLSGIVDDDGNPLVENPWGAFALDVLTDPSTYVGVGAAKSLVKPGVKASVPIVKNIVKSTDDIVKATADDMVEVFTSDGSKKLIKKADAVRVNRIEDANVNNNTFTNYEDGNWFSDDIQPFYLNNAKNTLKGGVLNPSDPKRVISAYLDPNDAKLFDVTKKGTSTALDMSGGSGNLPVKGEYVLPPALVKAMRSNQSGRGYSTLIGDSESIMNNLTKFYKKLGGSVYQNGGSSVQDNTSVPSRGQVIVNEEDEQIRKDNQVLGLSNILDYLVESRGGDQSIWTNLADNVAFHESGAQQRMDPQARQITNSGKRDGLGRGMFQFEPDSFETAQKRYKNVANAVGYTLDENILNAESALDLSAKDQYTLFFANLIESPAVLKDYGDGKSSMTDVWLTGHKNVSKPGNRASFAESQEAAKKELGERGFLQFTLEDLLPYKKGGEAHMFSTYKNYINGKTTSKDAIKIYDKLNRRYLKQARELGMSPANYVMTYIIGNS